MYPQITELGEQFNFNPKEDEFTVIQPYNDGQAIIVTMENGDERKMKLDISNSIYILPRKSGTLDLYVTEEE